jgi:hypothetical protein
LSGARAYIKEIVVPVSALTHAVQLSVGDVGNNELPYRGLSQTAKYPASGTGRWIVKPSQSLATPSR